MIRILLRSPLLVLPLWLSSCGPDPQLQALQAETETLTQRLRVLEDDVTRAQQEARAAERSLQELRAESLRKDKEAKTETDDARQKLEEVQKAFEDYKTKFRVTSRTKAVGLELAELDCGSEGIFKQVKVMDLTPGTVRFQHAAGITTVALGRMGPEGRDRFGYHPEEAAAWHAAEQQKQLQREEEALVAESKAATAQIKQIGIAAKNRNSAADARQRYEKHLASIYASARTLQADRTSCPVHKRWQLGEWAAVAARIKAKMAALPR